MSTIAMVVNGKLELIEVEKERYFVDKLLDSNMYGIFDSVTGDTLTWGFKKTMEKDCKQMNQKYKNKED